jgi:hypothetical protein
MERNDTEEFGAVPMAGGERPKRNAGGGEVWGRKRAGASSSSLSLTTYTQQLSSGTVLIQDPYS